MNLKPIILMNQRVKSNSESDTALFAEFLYLGEFIVKLTAASLTALVGDDTSSTRYGIMHGLVRADGIGEWTKKIDEILIGPSSHLLPNSIQEQRRVFTERVSKDAWQYEAVSNIHTILETLSPDTQPLGDKTNLRAWFSKFAEVRNKTRGHGAITPATCAILVPRFKATIDLMVSKNPLFLLPWAYLHRNMSGKYNVSYLGDNETAFESLKSADAKHGVHLADGVYIWADRPTRIDLLFSDLDTADFFLPNGAFNGRQFELHSPISDSRRKEDASPYLTPKGDKPASETEGKGQLAIVGEVFTNLPDIPTGYVKRPNLENKVNDVLVNDRHPVVTLVGRGGVGKTSLALTVLNEIAHTNRYSVIIWFSARDVDLTISGPKVVKPKVLAEADIAGEYQVQIGAIDVNANTPDSKTTINLMAEHMRESPNGPTLFVFDNFETMSNPVDLFHWIDTNIRLPNKVVITSRFREFKADYPITISGMETVEAKALIDQTATQLNISDLVDASQRDQVIEESDGHPYVIKIIMGEIEKTGKFGKPSQMVVRQDEILDALFERTFSSLSPLASLIFLTLSGWRSLVPQLAVEATFLRRGSGIGDPEKAIDELVRMSLIERNLAHDKTDFLGVPLSAALFAKRKLEVSPHREIAEEDIRFLQYIGPTTSSGLKDGIAPRIDQFFQKTASRIANGAVTLDELRSVLEFMARSHPPSWMKLAALEQEAVSTPNLEKAAEYIRRYLETRPTEGAANGAWRQLIRIYQESDNIVAGCSAFLRVAEITPPSLEETSNLANILNRERGLIDQMDVSDRGAIFKPMARLMEDQLDSCSATDLSRLAWLHLHAGETNRAREVSELGLVQEPNNRYCQSLVDRLQDGQ